MIVKKISLGLSKQKTLECLIEPNGAIVMFFVSSWNGSVENCNDFLLLSEFKTQTELTDFLSSHSLAEIPRLLKISESRISLLRSRVSINILLPWLAILGDMF